MTSEQLIAEGRKVQRPCTFLRPQGAGPIAAYWHERDKEKIKSSGWHCWITIDPKFVPGLPVEMGGYLRIMTDEKNGRDGRVEVVASWPGEAGTPLYAHSASVLPPVDAVFARGSDAVAEWIHSHGWEHTERYNSNFAEAAIVERYESVWFDEFPMFLKSDVYAVLGGWHWPCADEDWHELIEEKLMVMTFRDSEPWVEAWLARTGQFRVIQRRT